MNNMSNQLDSPEAKASPRSSKKKFVQCQTNGAHFLNQISSEALLALERRVEELETKILGLQSQTSKNEDTGSQTTETQEKEENVHQIKRRVRIVISRVDTETKERRDFEADRLPETANDGNKEQVLRKIIDSAGDDGEIEINDDGLLKLLHTLLRHYPGHFFDSLPLTLDAPYEPLIQNWDMLWEESDKKGTDDEQARADLRELLQAIRSGSGDSRLDTYLHARESLKKQGSITFDALWTIFPPGCIVYGYLFPGVEQIFIVEDNQGPWPSEEASDWALRCWVYDYTGRFFSRKRVTIRLEKFQGTKPISSLPFHPLKMNEKREEIERRLLASGNAFRRYCTAGEDDRMYKFTGQAILEKKGFRDIGVESVEDISSTFQFGTRSNSSQPNFPLTNADVMVDFESYFIHASIYAQIGTATVFEISECRCTDCENNDALRDLFKRYYDRKTGHEDDWEPLQIMLCPPRVLGYVLQEKQWAQLAVNCLSPVPEQDDFRVMDSLHLEDKRDGVDRKLLLYNLVKNHGIGDAQKKNKGYEINDIVAEKGKGLVILLYGMPGVGKTSTAEIVARAARKPLFAISVADIGTDAQHVERSFRRIFELATTWRAMLLIDEADVFLQSRTQGTFGPSAERSALVSVFLRVLDYYRGILFLTTNQIAQFDIAVQSRVHIALKYERLTADQTYKIFSNFINQYKDKGLVDHRSYKSIDDFAKKELPRNKFDGRQLRNIVTCAMGYARGTQNKMTVDHIRDVVQLVDDFKGDLSGQMMRWEERQKNTSSI